MCTQIPNFEAFYKYRPFQYSATLITQKKTTPLFSHIKHQNSAALLFWLHCFLSLKGSQIFPPLSVCFLTLRDWREADENRWMLGWVRKREEVMENKGAQGDKWTVIIDRTAGAAVYTSWKSSHPASSLTFGRGCLWWGDRRGQSMVSTGARSGCWRSEAWKLTVKDCTNIYYTTDPSMKFFSV